MVCARAETWASKRRELDVLTPSTSSRPLPNLVFLPQGFLTSLHPRCKTRQAYRSHHPIILLGTPESFTTHPAPLYALSRETFAPSFLHQRQTAPWNIEEQLHQKSVISLQVSSSRQKPTHVSIKSLAAFQQHNSQAQPCLEENQTFQPSQMAMRNRLHPLAVKYAKDRV